jgi:hypothetical protein
MFMNSGARNWPIVSDLLSSLPVDDMTLRCSVPRALFLAYPRQLARESAAAINVAGQGSHHCVV